MLALLYPSIIALVESMRVEIRVQREISLPFSLQYSQFIDKKKSEKTCIDMGSSKFIARQTPVAIYYCVIINGFSAALVMLIE